MRFREARDAVIKWLRAGGQPTEDVPFTYSYVQSSVTDDGFACAGAALGALMTPSEEVGDNDSARDVGEKIFGNVDTFFDFAESGLDCGDPHAVADYVETLEPRPSALIDEPS